MRNIIYVLIVAILVSCGQSPEEQLNHIQGYWEISEVTLPSGETKTFSISQNIDYIEILTDSTGVRKKVQPDIAGNFTTSLASENINISKENGNLIFKYSTAFDSWEETVLSANETMMVVKNSDGKTYTYQRYTPIVID